MQGVPKIAKEYAEYRRAQALLRANYTRVAERKEAIAIRDDFQASAPSYVEDLLDVLHELLDYTEGEECADPESCGRHSFRCSRCRLRGLGL